MNERLGVPQNRQRKENPKTSTIPISKRRKQYETDIETGHAVY